MAQPQEFPFNIMDVAELLHLHIRRRQADSVYANCPICGDKRGKMNINFAKNLWRCNYCNEGGGMLSLYGKVYGISNSEAYREICDTLQNGLTAPEYTAKELPEQTAIEPEPVIPWRIAGEVLDTYIVCEDEDKNVWLIDKHAAHERVNFDRMKANQEPLMCQALLAPLVAEFAAEEYSALAANLELLREFGFECEEFGGGSLILRAIPADIDSGDAIPALEELADKLVTAHTVDPAAARDALLHTMACKAAIKGGWKSDLSELRVLVDKVQSGEVQFCPHGRPVAVKLTKYELEKMFKRA